MWMLSGITRKQWVNLTVIFLMSVFSVYFVVYVIKPVERFTQSRDATRLSSVNTIKSALETYVATYKTIPACETISAAICPVSYVLDGADPVSKLLVDSKSLSTIPKQPVGTNNPFCEYRVFIYEAEKNKYFLRWCMESWTPEDVTRAVEQGGQCSWLGIGNIALCLTGTDLPLVSL